MVSIGKKLQEERLKQSFSLEEVSESTKIKISFLKYIEEGNYKMLPSPAYANGFVRNYVKFLGMPEKETMALFRREFDAEKELQVLPKGLSPETEFSLTRFKFGRGFFLGVFAAILLFGFIIYQYRAAVFNPSLNIDSPKEGEVVHSATLKVFGKTEPDSTVTVDDIPAAVDDSGNFRKEISVFPGSEGVQIVVVNRFGKKTSVVRHIDVKAAY